MENLARLHRPEADGRGEVPHGDPPGRGVRVVVRDDDSERQPPCANRGVDSNEPRTNRGKNTSIGGFPAGVGIDTLTVTLPTPEAGQLVTLSEFAEPGIPRDGFQKSEMRTVLGGYAWRRMEPHQSSKMWGRSYESWDASGWAARWLAERSAALESRASRVDVAFDFSVSPDYRPDDLAERIRPHLDDAGIGAGISGQAGRNTCYAGSVQSDRRVRIYRRDWKDPAIFDEYRTHLLRVEITLRGDRARAFWKLWKVDEQRGYAAAAAHIEQMTGLIVGEIGDIPPIEVSDDYSVAADLFQALQHASSAIVAAESIGVDVVSLAHQVQESKAEGSQYRHARRMLKFAKVDPMRLVKAVQLMCGTPCQDDPEGAPAFA